MAINVPENNDDRPGRPPYVPGTPEELDSVISAPENHEVLIENDLVRVLRVTLPPGQTGNLHTHKWPSVFIITSQSKMVYYNEKMEFVPTSGTRRENNPIYIGPEGLHTVENQGTRILEGIRIELKNR
jgi:mannose-6-phosphate isomerase-like protein (cupin superfamily)